ncbi:MAG: UDP-N-acetylmuramoyl-tripeptide--D-alanyl-D-alanine ligase [Clostridia bacterium]
MLNIKELEIATRGKIRNGIEKIIPTNYVIDSREVQKGDFYIPIVGANVDGHKYILDAVKKGAIGFFVSSKFSNIDFVIQESIKINKDISILEVEETQNALYEAGRFNRQKLIDIPIVAITGSVGKTSTREMIASVLKQEKNIFVTKRNYNGYIGLPIMMLEIDKEDICVLEVGIDKVGEMDLLADLVRPDIAVITMIGTAHIGNIGSVEKIFKEKLKIVNNIKGMATLVVNGDDSYLNKLDSTNKYVVQKYSTKNISETSFKNEAINFKTKIYNKECNICINQMGKHNILNALCAIKIGQLFGIKEENIIKGISEYKNFTKRLEQKRIGKDILVIDDTYNASIDSMISGLEAVDKLEGVRKIAVLGDMFELGSYSKKLHTKVGESFKDMHYDILYTLGEESEDLAAAASKYMPKGAVKCFKLKDELIKELKSVIKANDIIYFKASNLMRFFDIIEDIEKYFENK